MKARASQNSVGMKLPRRHRRHCYPSGYSLLVLLFSALVSISLLASHGTYALVGSSQSMRVATVKPTSHRQIQHNQSQRPTQHQPLTNPERQWIRKIEQSKNLSECMENFHAYQEYQRQQQERTTKERLVIGPYVATLKQCGKYKALTEAMEVYLHPHNPPNEACRAIFISVCGKCNRPDMAVGLLDDYYFNCRGFAKDYGNSENNCMESTAVGIINEREEENKVPVKKESAKTTDLTKILSVTSPSSTFPIPSPTVASYHAAMAACEDWRDAVQILYNRMPPSIRKTMSCNICLTILAKARRGTEALELLHRMIDTNSQPQSTSSNTTTTTSPVFPVPDATSYQRVLTALTAQGLLDEAYHLLESLSQQPKQEEQAQPHPNQAMYDTVQTAFGKQGNWTMVRTLEEKRHLKRLLNHNQSQNHIAPSAYCNSFSQWQEDGLIKVGKGNKSAYWIMGTLDVPVQSNTATANSTKSYMIALQPHKNPAKNGIKLLLFDNTNEDAPTKVGYLLMINAAYDNTSKLLGVWIDPRARTQGLSKPFLAVWMHICLTSGVRPITGVINKPLLCLVLQHTFGYQPWSNTGTDVEIIPKEEQGEEQAFEQGSIVLYSPTKALEGAFPPGDVKREKIVIVTTRPQISAIADDGDTPAHEASPKKRRVIRLKSPFVPPASTESHWSLLEPYTCRHQFRYTLSHESLRRVLLGHASSPSSSAS